MSGTAATLGKTRYFENVHPDRRTNATNRLVSTIWIGKPCRVNATLFPLVAFDAPDTDGKVDESTRDVPYQRAQRVCLIVINDTVSATSYCAL